MESVPNHRLRELILASIRLGKGMKCLHIVDPRAVNETEKPRNQVIASGLDIRWNIGSVM
jgi:hypothetical protein